MALPAVALEVHAKLPIMASERAHKTFEPAASKIRAAAPIAGIPGAEPLWYVSTVAPFEFFASSDDLSLYVLAPAEDFELEALFEAVRSVAPFAKLCVETLAAALEAGPSPGAPLLAARGTEAVPGTGWRWQEVPAAWSEFARESAWNGPSRDEATVSLVAHRAGSLVAFAVPSVAPRAGTTLWGETFFARNTLPAPPVVGSTVVDVFAGLVLTSEPSIAVRTTGERTVVEPCHWVVAEAISSLDVFAVESIVVEGDLDAGTTISSSRNVVVAGSVVGGRIQAAGAVHVSGDVHTDAVVVAVGDVNIASSLDASLKTRGTLHARGCIERSEIVGDSGVFVAGSVRGGELSSSYAVACHSIEASGENAVARLRAVPSPPSWAFLLGCRVEPPSPVDDAWTLPFMLCVQRTSRTSTDPTIIGAREADRLLDQPPSTEKCSLLLPSFVTSDAHSRDDTPAILRIVRNLIASEAAAAHQLQKQVPGAPLRRVAIYAGTDAPARVDIDDVSEEVTPPSEGCVCFADRGRISLAPPLQWLAAPRIHVQDPSLPTVF